MILNHSFAQLSRLLLPSANNSLCILRAPVRIEVACNTILAESMSPAVFRFGKNGRVAEPLVAGS
ncbi:hypothetical protein HUU59_03500 [bacterium]|nr:hypothetical protein [bacterium]